MYALTWHNHSTQITNWMIKIISYEFFLLTPCKQKGWINIFPWEYDENLYGKYTIFLSSLSVNQGGVENKSSLDPDIAHEP